MSGGRVLVAEDDARARDALVALLEEEGYDVECTADGMAAGDRVAAGNFDAVLLDVRMPGKDGLSLLREWRDWNCAPAVLVMTAYGTSAVAIEAMKLGAYDYLTKPLHFEEVLIQLERAIAARRQTAALQRYGDVTEEEQNGVEIVGNSPAMQQVYKLIGQVAPTDSTVLIRGESGTGKELVARALHRHSPRRQRRLITVNCAAIPETLLEAELFGYERGAFTGAISQRKGRFELAGGGTVFLDEIGELPPSTQTKLLRVVQERTVERLGSERTFTVDVRIIAATNRDLEAAVRGNSFRQDLYYRLNVLSIWLPPLSKRREDIPELTWRLLKRLASQRKLPLSGIAPEAVQALCEREWPGNVRELEHTLERALVLSRGAPITPEHLAPEMMEDAADPFGNVPLEEGMHTLVSQLERRLIERALSRAGGNRTRAAEILKINRRLLYDKLREYGLE
ncbi:MAG: sigma-54 dependent transcriptional regulator [Bryobacterales bacterium]|nr:sigma-54 dependent transcriptional regulator [Bryobacterales bacterium]